MTNLVYTEDEDKDEDDTPTPPPPGAIDYRNIPLPELLAKDPERWTTNASILADTPSALKYSTNLYPHSIEASRNQRPLKQSSQQPSDDTKSNRERGSDPNSRGRGRTLETQSGGLAVVRAWYELSHSRSHRHASYTLPKG